MNNKSKDIMAKKQSSFIPFSNGTEAMMWMDVNCDICKRRPCYPRRSLERGFISGEITENLAIRIGKEGSRLNKDCSMFTDKKIVKDKPKQGDMDDKFHYKMF